MSLEEGKEIGKRRIDRFFKRKNIQHTQTYKDKIIKEEMLTERKAHTIRKLENMEEALRKRLQESSMKVSQADQLIGNLSKTIIERNTKSRMSMSASRQKISMSTIRSGKQQRHHNKEDGSIDFMLTNIEAELMDEKSKSQTTSHRQGADGEVEEDIRVKQ